ncbi:MAG: PA2169 family four-helix-bundle protein [Bacteroidota bacterium]|jgi:uncharacterized protein (TIGR02284 family)
MKSESKLNDLIMTLIIVNEDRYNAFESAKSIVDEAVFKTWLDKMSNQSLSFKNELYIFLSDKAMIESFSPDHGTLSGKIYKIWMDIKSFISKDKLSGIISSLEFGEDSALKIYDEVLSNRELLSEELFDTINRHQLKIKEDFITLSKLSKLEESET